MTNIYQLIEAYEDYIRLLSDEINDLVSIAHVHGWKTKRYQASVDARNRISNLKKKLDEQ